MVGSARGRLGGTRKNLLRHVTLPDLLINMKPVLREKAISDKEGASGDSEG